jgi:hypothetical protein
MACHNGAVEEELGLGWPPVYIPLDRDKLPTRVTRPRPRGPAAIGLGPDWSGVRDVGKESFGRVEGADILRKRPTLATDQQGVVETEGDDDQGHARDRENGIFPVMA